MGSQKRRTSRLFKLAKATFGSILARDALDGHLATAEIDHFVYSAVE
jgi:hypothetical protein